MPLATRVACPGSTVPSNWCVLTRGRSPCAGTPTSPSLASWIDGTWKGSSSFSAWMRTAKSSRWRSRCPRRAGKRSSGCRVTRSPRGRDARPSGSRRAWCASKAIKIKCWWAKASLRSTTSPTNACNPSGWSSCAKTLVCSKATQVLFKEIRYFFYITKRRDFGAEEIVSLANGRCDQENVIEQLKNGVNAMRMPVDDLLSNWAYMVMTALAWNLKAWFGLLLPDGERGIEVVRMEFRRFLHSLILLPAQIDRTRRRIIYRIMAYNAWVKDLFAAWECLRRLHVT